MARRRRPHLLPELLVVFALLRVYDLVREHAAVRTAAAERNGRWLLAAEASLHGDLERSAAGWTAAHRVVEQLAEVWYQYAHVTVTMAVLGWCWMRRPEVYRWARSVLVLINLAGLVVFFAVPVAPPRLLPGAGIVDGARVVGFGSGTGPVHADQYGAMPSLHVAWAVWVAIVCVAAFPSGRRRVWAGLYPATTAVIVVLTGNHYLLDVAAGALTTVLAARVVTVLRPSRSRHRAGWLRALRPALQQLVDPCGQQPTSVLARSPAARRP